MNVNLKAIERACIHSIDFKQCIGTNNYGKPLYAAPITINHVRFDDNRVWTRSGNNAEITANAIIFIYPFVTALGIDLSKAEKSVITFKGNEYTVNKIVRNFFPYEDKIFSYELEVL